MKRVFICSPYRGDTRSNVARARKMCRLAITCGCQPFAPHLLYPQFLSDLTPAQRLAGIECGRAFLVVCDQIWVPEGVTPSEGMIHEMDVADACGIEIVEVAV